ncbi:MAG TPA: 50S ribosomal protein L21 [Candidatus Saccharimonadales bacterium]
MKAVINLGGQQHLVSKDDLLSVDRLAVKKKSLTLMPLLVIDKDNTLTGSSQLKNAMVTLEIIDPEAKGPKLKIMKFQAKKRVKKLTGHRQLQSVLKVRSITVK